MPDSNRRLWLIDAAYMMMSQSSVGPQWRFDYKKLRDKLEDLAGAFFQVYYVNSTPNPPTDQQDAFHTWLKSAPPKGPKFQVRLYKLKDLHMQCPSCNNAFDRKVQKGVDIGITTLALTLVDRYDTLVLSSGDGDFKDAMEHIRNTLNKGFELAAFKNGLSTDLQSISDEVYWIDDFIADVEKS